MTRLTFPQDRTTYVYQGAGQPILTPPRTGIELFTDAAGHAPADLLWPDLMPVGRSTVYTGEDGLLPEFLGPDGVRLLYGQVVGTTGLYPVEPRMLDLVVDVVGAGPVVDPGLTSGHGAPGSGTGTSGGFYVDLDAKALWGPKSPGDVWPVPPIELSPVAPPPPPAPLTEFTYTIGAPVTEVTFTHPLTPYPSVIYLDPFNEECLCDVSYPSAQEVTARFGLPSIGKLRAFV